jgi:hypothetical protein
MPVGLLLAGAAATKGAEAVAVVAAGLTAYKVRTNGKDKAKVDEEAANEAKEAEETDMFSTDLESTGLDDDYDIANWLPGAHMNIDGDSRQSIYSTRSNLDDYNASAASGLPDLKELEKSTYGVASHKQNLTGSGWTAFIWGQKARTDDQLAGAD